MTSGDECGNQRFDALDEFVAGVDIDTGVFIGQILFGHR